MKGCTNPMGAIMRKLFSLGMSVLATVMLGNAAQAADMPLKAPPPPAPVMYNWTGFYIGAHVGGAWRGNGNDRFDGAFDCINNVCFDNNGFGRNNGRFIGGGQIGYNYQVNQFVWGIEGQISGVASNNDDQACGFFTVGLVHDSLFRCRDRSGWLASIAARLGVAFGQTGNWLLYVKGGGAFADANFGLRFRDDCSALTVTALATLCNTGGTVFNNNNNTRTGWMFGVGLEYGAWGNWSWKLEYNLMEFGNRDIHFDNAFIVTGCPAVGCRLIHDIDFDRQINVVKFGLNYRFAPAAAPVAARY
jgi:outer membrane immunogenic protein